MCILLQFLKTHPEELTTNIENKVKTRVKTMGLHESHNAVHQPLRCKQL